MTNCKNCKQEFTSKRATAVFCSAKCRNLAFREVSVAKEPKISVATDKNVSVANVSVAREGKSEIREGYCHGCNEKQTGAHLICICVKCISSGITHQSLNLNLCS